MANRRRYEAGSILPPPPSPPDFRSSGELESALTDAIRKSDPAAGESALDRMFSMMWVLSDGELEDFRALLVRLMATIQHWLVPNGLSLEALGIRRPYLSHLSRIASYQEARAELGRVVKWLCETAPRVPDDPPGTMHAAIQQAVNYIDAHYAEHITLAALSGMVYLNSSHFSVLFKRETGRNFTDYLTCARMERAKALLKLTPLKVYRIGEQVGYNNPRYFSDSFRKYAGMSPGAYRRAQTPRRRRLPP